MFPKEHNYLDPNRGADDAVGLWGSATRKKSYILDTETTGILTGFRHKLRTDVGITQVALREAGAKGETYTRFTDIIKEPMRAYMAGKITAEQYGALLESGGPSGIRWQRGYKQYGNVLFGSHEALVKATRSALDPATKQVKHPLASQEEIVEKLTGVLKAGHEVKGWNVQFDLLMHRYASARLNPALEMKWAQAINYAREAGNIVDMASGVKRFMYLGMHESFMRQKVGGDAFYTPSMVNKGWVDMAERGKLSLSEIDALTADKILEPHKGFQDMLEEWYKGGKRTPKTWERYLRDLERAGLLGNKAQTFATGMVSPNIDFVKGWSADVIAETLSPGILTSDTGIKGSTLEREVTSWMRGRGYKFSGNLKTHEALTDTMLEEFYEDLFQFKSNPQTAGAAWEELAPRMRKFKIHSMEQFFQRQKVAIVHKSRSQLAEHAFAQTSDLGDLTRWLEVLEGKQTIASSAAEHVARGSRAKAGGLKQLFSKAQKEVSGGWRNFEKAHPLLAGIAAGFAAYSITDALLPEDRILPGVRDPRWNRVQEAEGIQAGFAGFGPMRALTDFGSGRSTTNEVTRTVAEVRTKDRHTSAGTAKGYIYEQEQRNQVVWTKARAAESRATRPTLATAERMDNAAAGFGDAYQGVVDRMLVEEKITRMYDAVDADVHPLVSSPSKASRTLTGIPDLPAAQFEGAEPGVEMTPKGELVAATDRKLIEKQQSLRQVYVPDATPGGSHYPIDHDLSRTLQRARELDNVKVNKVEANILAEAGAIAASGKLTPAARQPMDRAVAAAAQLRAQAINEQGRRAVDYYENVARAVVPPAAAPRPALHLPLQGYQAGMADRNLTMSALNERVKNIGFLPGIRQQSTPWNTAGYGIRPSQMQFGNVTLFSSGSPQWSTMMSVGKHDPIRGRAWREKFRKPLVWGQANMSVGEVENIYRNLRVYSATPTGFYKRNLIGASHHLRNISQKSLAHAANIMGVPLKGGLPIIDPIAMAMADYGTGKISADVVDQISKKMAPSWRGTIEEMKVISKELTKFGQGAEIYDLIKSGRADGPAALVELSERSAAHYEGRAVREELLKVRTRDQVRQAKAVGGMKDTTQSQAVYQQGRADRLRKARRPWAGADRGQTSQAYYQRSGINTKRQRPRPTGAASRGSAVRAGEESAEAVQRLGGIYRTGKSTSEPVAEKIIEKKPTAGMKPRGRMLTYLGVGAAVGAALWYISRKSKEHSETMAYGPAYRSPNEFASMKQYGYFPSGYSEHAWNQMQEYQPHFEEHGESKLALFAEIGLWMKARSWGLTKPHVWERGWEHFASGKAGSAATKKVIRGMRDILKKEGYTPFEVRAWLRRQHVHKGFMVKVESGAAKGAAGSSWFQNTWKGVQDKTIFSKLERRIAGPDPMRYGKHLKARAKAWFEGLFVKPVAAQYGKSAQEFLKAAQGAPISNLKKLKHMNRFREEVAGFKYMWKNLVTQEASFMGKMKGAMDTIFNRGAVREIGLGTYSKTAMAHKLGFHDPSSPFRKMLPDDITKPKPKLEAWANSLREKISDPAWRKKHPKWAPRYDKLANKMEALSKSRIMQLGRRLPLFSVAIGTIHGLSNMSQYNSKVKGFLVEGSAAAVETAVSFAFFNPAMWKVGAGLGAKAGAAIGSAIFPGIGTAVGAAVGAVAGYLAGIGISLFVGGYIGQMAGEATRNVASTMIGAKKRGHAIDPDQQAMLPEEVYNGQLGYGFGATRGKGVSYFNRIDGVGTSRPDMSSFGSGYVPDKGIANDMGTLLEADSKRKKIKKFKKPMSRPTGFTPTHGLVNNVLWDGRKKSILRSQHARMSGRRTPTRDRNRSRMLTRSAA